MEVKKTPREHLSEFIELYRSYTCLWLIGSKEYSDRTQKDLAYVELVKKYREFDPSADRNIVVKKINSLRTVYKKELSKVIESAKSGEIYKPTLWYFELLHFLNYQEPEMPYWSPVNGGKEDTQAVYSAGDSEPACLSPIQHLEVVPAILPTSDDDASTSFQSVTPTPTVPRAKRKKNMISTNGMFQPTEENLRNIRPDDEFEAFGNYIAHKIRSLKGNQAIFARKLINDVIFEGELEGLTKDFRVMNCQPHRSFQNNNY